MYKLRPVTIEQIFTFTIENNKTFCRNDAFGVKTFDLEQLEKPAEYSFDLVNCSFKNDFFPKCEKLGLLGQCRKKDGDSDILNSYQPL